MPENDARSVRLTATAKQALTKFGEKSFKAVYIILYYIKLHRAVGVRGRSRPAWLNIAMNVSATTGVVKIDRLISSVLIVVL